MRILAVLMLCLFAMSSNAEAAHRYHHYRHVVHVVAPKAWSFTDLFGITTGPRVDQRRTRSTIHPVAHKFQDRLPQEQTFGFPPTPPPITYHQAAGGLSSPCRTAAHLGGPCGCFAAELIFGQPIRALWVAAAWLAFPHVTPAPQMAAVWPNHHHVAIVESVNGDGTVTVHDSWATHRVSASRLTFVDPHRASL